jgi:hypothetical protein
MEEPMVERVKDTLRECEAVLDWGANGELDRTACREVRDEVRQLLRDLPGIDPDRPVLMRYIVPVQCDRCVVTQIPRADMYLFPAREERYCAGCGLGEYEDYCNSRGLPLE